MAICGKLVTEVAQAGLPARLLGLPLATHPSSGSCCLLPLPQLICNGLSMDP